MRQIRPLEEADIDDFLRITRGAFPGAGFPTLERHRERFRDTLDYPDLRYRVVVDDERIVGAYRTHDFRMNVFGRQLSVAGLGGVVVALADKKRKVARDIVHDFHSEAARTGAALTALYPFRSSFYARMGYGFGAPMTRYRLRPDSLPADPDAAPVRELDEVDRPEVEGCHARVQARTHGLFALDRNTAKALCARGDVRTVGAFVGGRLEAFARFGFIGLSPENPLRHDVEVHDFEWETTAGLRALLAFLRRQADQVERIRLCTQDPHLQHLFEDPLDGSGKMFQISACIGERALGVMYRLLDPATFFEALADHDFGLPDGELAIELEDGFWPATSAPLGLRTEGGRTRVEPAAAGAARRLAIGVGDFSSVLVGVLPLRRLVDYGRARWMDERPGRDIESAFAAPDPPRCSTRF